MTSAHLWHSHHDPWLRRHDGLVDGILILLGALMSFLLFTSHPEAFWH